MEIDRESGEPFWQQIEADLRRRIEAHELTGALPSQSALAEKYGVVPLTVRKALKKLRDDGLIATAMGKGSRVLPQ